MFARVLVANRGEIAVRVQQTLHSLGIESVAVYSDPDAAAPHVSLADHACPLGGHTAEETYLDAAKLVDAARRSGAQAVHPGYGFLSEDPGFAAACRDAGLVFIGPPPESMAALGDKVRAKEMAAGAGVPVVPSSPVCQPASQEAWDFARRWGFPLLVKAAAGGGGRGMRLVEREEDLAQALESAGREARAAFGDGRVFLERYISRPRHVEVQVLADAHGSAVHLGERECSVQRRHQKIMEEAPSPALTPELRERMGAAAVTLCRAAGYVNAGTVEFLLNPEQGEFYFLEMNARLQVEHPVTEALLGIDLVACQVSIAAGGRLPQTSRPAKGDPHNPSLPNGGWGDFPRGHALECRIYAEDPYHQFVPAAGTLARWRPPSGPGLRLDSGVTEGQEVSVYYDPLLAKLVAWGPDRASCLARMEVALSNFPVLGVVTNIPLLRRVVRHPRFQDGGYHTHFLEDHPELLQPEQPADTARLAQALAAWWGHQNVRPPSRPGDGGPPTSSSPWRDAGRRRLP